MFPCTKCGLCCAKIGGVLKLKSSRFQKEIDEFPYAAKEDGSCEMLKDGLCSVYENRPNICNIGFMKEKYGLQDVDIAASCNVLIYQYGDQSKLVKI